MVENDTSPNEGKLLCIIFTLDKLLPRLLSCNVDGFHTAYKRRFKENFCEANSKIMNRFYISKFENL